MLKKYLSNPISTNEQLKAKLLLKKLLYLPLAIVQAAAYINVNKIELKNYLSRLAEQKEEIIKFITEGSENKQQHRSKRNPIATT